MTEAEEWREERDLALWKEAIDVQGLYKYQVTILPENQTYLCNEIEPSENPNTIRLIDAWVYDALMAVRCVRAVTIVAKEIVIIALRAPDA